MRALYGEGFQRTGFCGISGSGKNILVICVWIACVADIRVGGKIYGEMLGVELIEMNAGNKTASMLR